MGGGGRSSDDGDNGECRLTREEMKGNDIHGVQKEGKVEENMDGESIDCSSPPTSLTYDTISLHSEELLLHN